MNPIDPNGPNGPNVPSVKPPAGKDPGTGDPAGDIQGKEEQINQHAGAISDLAGVASDYDPKKKLAKVNNPYGKQLMSFAEGAATTVDGASAAFGRYPGLATRIRMGSARVTLLTATNTVLKKVSRGVSYLLGQATVDLVEGIGLVINIRDAVVTNRGSDPKDVVQMERASTLLTQLRSGRAASSAGKSKSTKATGAQLADAHTQIAKLQVEKKFISGGQLTPDDVMEPAAIPSGKKVAKDTTTAAKTTTTSGKGRKKK